MNQAANPVSGLTVRKRSWRWLAAGWLVPLLLLAACLPAGQRMEQSPLLAALERKSGLIAYVGVDGNIHVVNQGGAEEQTLTDDAIIPRQGDSDTSFLFYGLPVWSTHGRQIAYAAMSGDATGLAMASIYTAEADGSRQQMVFESEFPLIYMFWAPDDSQISFLNNTPTGGVSLQAVPGEGDAPVALEIGQSIYWDWSPNARQIAAHIDQGTAEARVAVLTVDASVVEEVLDLESATYQAPDLSPDGSRLLAAALTDERGIGLALASGEGGIEDWIVFFEGNPATSFAFSPDGQKVAYLTGQSAESQTMVGRLSVVDLDAPPEDLLRAPEEQVAAFFWSPDSQQIAYFTLEFVRPAEDETGAASDEGSAVPIAAIHVMDVESGESRDVVDPFVPTPQFLDVIVFSGQYVRSATIWSPDSANLVYTGIDPQAEAPRVWVAAASGALQPRSVGFGVLAFWSRE